jgi:signal peptidase I
MDQNNSPTPLQPARVPQNRPTRIIALCFIVAGIIGTLLLLRISGLVRSFFVPTGAMTPAVSAGDHVMMEGVTFLSRQPRPGDIVVFKTAGIALLPPGQIYVKRVAGGPGDKVRLSEGKLFINDKQLSLSNALGEISYHLPPVTAGVSVQTNVSIPQGCYFVLGDTSTNSYDSRFWGTVPRENIIGRISFCYWPPRRVGLVE